MSRKLVSLIQDNKRLSAKYKRTLCAYAARANNDGTNIFASKKTIGEKYTLSRSTIYHNTPDLVRAGILVQATSHTCKVPACNKGGTHYWGVQGKYTVVYNINLSALGNDETYLVLNRLKVPLPKQLNLFVQNRQKVALPKLDATQSLEPTPVSLSDKDSSVLTDGVSSLASQIVPKPSASPEAEQQEQNQNQTVVLQQDKPESMPGVKALAFQLGCDQQIPRLLGIPYFYADDHDAALKTMAETLMLRSRSIHWLTEMTTWIKKHPFWSKRVHTGTRGVNQLAKHLANNELCEQFDAHLILTQGEDILTTKYCYVENHFAKAQAG